MAPDRWDEDYSNAYGEGCEDFSLLCHVCGAQDGDRTLAGGTVEVENDLCQACREECPGGRRRPQPSYMDEDGDHDEGIPF